MIKAKNKQQKLIKHESHKKYRNKIIELTRQSKQTYHQRYFEQNKKRFQNNMARYTCDNILQKKQKRK